MNNNQIKVIVDAGHGGDDPGAIGNNVYEKDLNLRAAKYMYKRLQELGIPSKIIRDVDENLPKSERIKRVLEAYNNAPNTILISNHINAGGGEGAEIVYALRNDETLARMALDNIGEAGQIKRNVYQRVLPENPSKDYYYILRETGNTEPLLVEYGFIDNENDIKKLTNDLELYVEGVVKEIANYAGYMYIPPQINDYYIVKKGDTLYSIASKFNTTVENIKRLNNLKTDTISIGEKLRLKEDDQGEKTYTVIKGDTLYSIATTYNTTVEKIKQINNLTSNNLTIGQKLIIPQAEENKEQPSSSTYVVQKGDSLWSIAKKYDTTVDTLIKLNNLNTINLQIGDILIVPEKENIKYIVQKGDTLWSIAKKNNLTPEELKNINKLTNNLLTIGQALIIQKKRS